MTSMSAQEWDARYRDAIRSGVRHRTAGSRRRSPHSRRDGRSTSPAVRAATPLARAPRVAGHRGRLLRSALGKAETLDKHRPGTSPR